AATVAAGELRLAQAKPALLVLSDDSDSSVRIAAKFALHRLGDTRQSRDLERSSIDPNPRTRGDTALVVGPLGEPSASKVLAPLAFGTIGRPDAQEYLAPLLKDADPDTRLCAAKALLQLKG